MQRFEILNTLIRKYNFKNYLEIGVYTGQNIREVIAEHKDGVDPGTEGQLVPEVNYPITSDEFFDLIKDHPEIQYDLIFIDGMHEATQVLRDFYNSLKHLKPNGIIMFHDCNPEKYEYTTVPRQTGIWHGDVYKAILRIVSEYNNRFITVDTDCGCGIFFNDQVKENTEKINQDLAQYDWKYFDSHRKSLLNLVTVKQFKKEFESDI